MTEEKSFTRARVLIKHEAYDDAIQIYEKLRERIVNDSLLLKELGLAYALNGKPYEALMSWMDIVEPDEDMVSLMEITYRQLPTYNTIFDEYNEAILALKEGQFQQAQLLLHRICTQSLPLPIYVYEAFILAMQYGGNEDKVEVFVNKWPRRIQKHPKIQVLLQLKHTIEEQTEELHILEDEQHEGRKQNWMLYTAIVVVIVAALLAILWSQLKSEIDKDNKAAIEQQELVQQDTIVDENPPLDEVTETPNTTTTAKPLTEQEIKVIYDQGLAAYEAGKYNEARDVFEHGTTVDQSSYMADDMVFFLAKTYEALGDKTRANELYDIVVTNEGKVFVNSSYRDDSLLRLVAAYKVEDPAYAKTLAQRIVDEYPNEWTATLAKQQLEELQ